jgi:hypothetical protein
MWFLKTTAKLPLVRSCVHKLGNDRTSCAAFSLVAPKVDAATQDERIPMRCFVAMAPVIGMQSGGSHTLGPGGVGRNCIHQRRRQAVVRLEAEFLQSRAHCAHLRRVGARLDDR